MGLVGVLQRHHLMVELVDVERIGPDEHAFEPLQVGPAGRSGDSGLADAKQAGVRLDAHQALAGRVFGLRGFDGGDPDASAFSFGVLIQGGHGILLALLGLVVWLQLSSAPYVGRERIKVNRYVSYVQSQPHVEEWRFQSPVSRVTLPSRNSISKEPSMTINTSSVSVAP